MDAGEGKHNALYQHIYSCTAVLLIGQMPFEESYPELSYIKKN